MSSAELGRVLGGDSALKSLLRKAIDQEKAGAVIPQEVMQFGLLGSAMVIATGLLALILPSAESIRNGDFFWILGSVAAGLDSVMGTVATEALIGVGGLLLLDVCLMRVRTSWRWRSVVVAQVMAGGLAGAFGTIFLALVVLNIAIWIVIYALTFIVIGGIIVSLAVANLGSD
jgi:hypothetical protein